MFSWIKTCQIVHDLCATVALDENSVHFIWIYTYRRKEFNFTTWQPPVKLYKMGRHYALHVR